MQNCLSQYGVRFVKLALSQFHEDHLIKHVVAVASDLMDKVIQNELSAPSRSKPQPVQFLVHIVVWQWSVGIFPGLGSSLVGVDKIWTCLQTISKINGAIGLPGGAKPVHGGRS